MTRVGFPRPRQIPTAEQLQRPAGQRLQRLAQVLTPGANPLQLKADPAGIAPERLVVFELTADVSGFMRAAARVPGLEFVGADELEAQGGDRDPALYLMIPDSRALTQIPKRPACQTFQSEGMTSSQPFASGHYFRNLDQHGRKLDFVPHDIRSGSWVSRAGNKWRDGEPAPYAANASPRRRVATSVIV